MPCVCLWFCLHNRLLMMNGFRAGLYRYDAQLGTLSKQVYVGVTPTCLLPEGDYIMAAQGTNAIWCLDAAIL